MPQSTYTFRARDAAGQVITGSMVASSSSEIAERLRADGKFLLAVHDRPMRGGAELDAAEIRRSDAARGVRREDVIAFCQQLSVMLETGVPISEALDAFSAQQPRQQFRVVLEALRQSIHDGEPLSTAMGRWPRAFPTMMISLMKASEASGTMSLMLGRIGSYLAKERRTARQIRGALGYPIFMMTAGLLMTVFLMTFVLPRFATIYESRSAILPAPTRFLLGVSEFMTTQYHIYVPLVAAAIVGAAIGRRRPSGRRALDWLRLNVPVLRGMYRQMYITRTARTMSTLLAAGVNLLDIIDICRGVTNNVYYDRFWNGMDRGIRDGRGLSETITGSTLIPPNVASMIASGERSGRLAQVMDRIAEFSDEELDTTIKRVTSYVEPVMIILMGIIVGGIAMALLLPVFSMGRVMAGG